MSRSSAARRRGSAILNCGVYGKKNVLDFDKSVRIEVKSKLKASGDKRGGFSIGSPIGKVKITEPWAEHFERFKIAVESAEFLVTPDDPDFQLLPRGGWRQDMRKHRDEVIRRMRAKVEYIKNSRRDVGA